MQKKISLYMEKFKPIAIIAFLFLLGACNVTDPELAPLPTEICVQTQHHHQRIPGAVVYVKYNADSFPGYDKPASYYDDVFYTGQNARGCIAPVPEGRHWMVSFGYDSLYFPHEVWGSLRLDISLTDSPKVDTVLYISEKH